MVLILLRYHRKRERKGERQTKQQIDICTYRQAEPKRRPETTL